MEQCSDEINGMIIANIGDNITYNDDIAIQTVVIRIKVSSNGECISKFITIFLLPLFLVISVWRRVHI